MKNKTAWIIGGILVAGGIIYLNRKKVAPVTQTLPATTPTQAVTTPVATTNPAVNTGIVPPAAPSASSGLKPGPGVNPKDTTVIKTRNLTPLKMAIV